MDQISSVILLYMKWSGSNKNDKIYCGWKNKERYLRIPMSNWAKGNQSSIKPLVVSINTDIFSISCIRYIDMNIIGWYEGLWLFKLFYGHSILIQFIPSTSNFGGKFISLDNKQVIWQ